MKMRSVYNKLSWVFVAIIGLSISLVPSPWAVGIVHATPVGTCAGFADVDAHYYMCKALQYMSTNPSPPLPGPAVTGYNDQAHCGLSVPCFRPRDNVTRGQFCKILVLAFGWSFSTSGGPHFTDVPPGSDFYPYIETAFSKGIIAGYNTAPPCPSGGVPCFLPNNPVSRGQMAKMASNSAGAIDDTTNRQATYADVPYGSPFFVWVERLTIRVSVAPYPPDMTQPPLTVSTPQKPNFYPNAAATRADVVEHIYLAIIGSDPYGQVFPHKYGGSAGWDAIQAYVATPDPGIIGGNYNYWVAAPVALTQYYSGHFVESGPTKDCLDINNPATCRRFPYASWAAGTTAIETDLTNQPLSAGAGYTFRSDADGYGVWKPRWCDIYGCYPILNSTNNDTGNLGPPSLPFWVAGGETDNLYQHWGNIYIYNVAAHSYNNGWISSCYDPVIVPIRAGYGTEGPCTNVSDWIVNY